jgi:hypothetical protein
MTDVLPSAGLVACGKAKLDRPAPARDLYTGSLFRAASAHAERAYDHWYVVSAHHGLVEPDEVLHPYDHTLTELRQAERDAWGRRVVTRLQSSLRHLGHQVPWVQLGSSRPDLTRELELWIHAGETYVRPLWFPLRLHPTITVHTPMQGLQIGQQLRWYAERREAA